MTVIDVIHLTLLVIILVLVSIRLAIQVRGLRRPIRVCPFCGRIVDL
jgi:hypothetical protein